jgi:hypothetical protein
VWLYIPVVSTTTSGPYLSAQESAGLTLESASLATMDSGQEVELSVTSSGKPMQRPLSWRGWKARPWIELLFGTISNPSRSKTSLAEWIKLWAESPANPIAPLGRSSEQKMSETSGQLRGACSDGSEPISSSLRTSGDSEAPRAALSDSLGTLPKSGSLVNGVLSAVKCWRPHIAEREFSGLPMTPSDLNCFEAGTSEASQESAWPTPSAVSYGSNKGGAAGRVGLNRPSLQSLGRDFQVPWPTPRAGQKQGADTGQHGGPPIPNLMSLGVLWPSPKARDWKNGMGGQSRKDPDLNSVCHSWPTPQARDSKGTPGAGATHQNLHKDAISFSGHQDNLQSSGTESLNTSGQVASPRRHLNVLFVEYLMGFPTGYSAPTVSGPTDYEAWETRCRRLLGQWLGVCSPVELATAMETQEASHERR